jgi:hypothetical protein
MGYEWQQENVSRIHRLSTTAYIDFSVMETLYAKVSMVNRGHAVEASMVD